MGWWRDAKARLNLIDTHSGGVWTRRASTSLGECVVPSWPRWRALFRTALASPSTTLDAGALGSGASGIKPKPSCPSTPVTPRLASQTRALTSLTYAKFAVSTLILVQANHAMERAPDPRWRYLFGALNPVGPPALAAPLPPPCPHFEFCPFCPSAFLVRTQQAAESRRRQHDSCRGR